MQQDIGIAMAHKLPRMRNLDPTQPQRPARLEAVRILAITYAQITRGWGLPYERPACGY